jgi:hypothetical protein
LLISFDLLLVINSSHLGHLSTCLYIVVFVQSFLFIRYSNNIVLISILLFCYVCIHHLIGRRQSKPGGSGGATTVFDPFLSFCRSTALLAKQPISFVDEHLRLAIDTLVMWCSPSGPCHSPFVWEQAIHALWKLTMQAPSATAVVDAGIPP